MYVYIILPPLAFVKRKRKLRRSQGSRRSIEEGKAEDGLDLASKKSHALREAGHGI
jgi:hypothetical protein